MASCINLQLPIVILKKIDYFRHVSSYTTYISIFSKIGLVYPSKTVLTSIFAKIRKLNTFATTNSNFEKNRLFQTCIIVKHTCISIFSKIGLVYRSVKTVQTNLFAKNCKLHKYATCN